MYWSRSLAKGLGFLLLLAIAFITALFDFLTFLVEEHPYIFVIVVACATLLTYKVISYKWGSKAPKIDKTGSESPWQKLVGRKDIRINGVVRNITWKKKPNQPDRYYVNWDGKMILLNVWKKQAHFSVKKGKRYLFSNISCRLTNTITKSNSTTTLRTIKVTTKNGQDNRNSKPNRNLPRHHRWKNCSKNLAALLLQQWKM